jgi:hypothetical protein
MMAALWAGLLTRDGRKWLLARPHGYLGLFRTAWCRLRGHPAGVVFYDPIGTEPDMTCKNCGDNLG